MAAVDDLIAQIADARLRDRLAREWAEARQSRKFGLVFEQHLPEVLVMPRAKARAGCRVCLRDDRTKAVWHVRRVADGIAWLERDSVVNGEREKRNVAVEQVQVVRRFGDPIFPALTPVDRVQNGGADAPWHTLIEADNYHALQLLEYLYAGKVDCIYIDPPYNTGARDWKYNNDYVDSNDAWRHSKWLAFMERRLRLAWRLLRIGGILCITVDDYEDHRLRCLVEQLFDSGSVIGQVAIRNNPSGRSTVNGLSVSHEYALLVGKGAAAKLTRFPRSIEQWGRFKESDVGGPFEWRNFRKDGGATTYRTARPKQYYPIFVKDESFRIPQMTWNRGERKWDVEEREKSGEVILWPKDDDGNDRVWCFSPSSAKARADELAVRRQGSKVAIARKYRPSEAGVLPRTWWDRREYSAREYGSAALKSIFGETQVFPFAKSPYATRDCLWMIGADKPDALIVDFFCGSGTTLEAVLALNAADGGHRRCIMVTNNEVSSDEADALHEQSFNPGDVEWEASGICQQVTWPRSKYTILGKRDDGSALAGDYLTGATKEVEKPRKFTHVGFVDPAALDKPATRKQLVALIDKLPQTLVKAGSDFIVSADHDASVLFDLTAADAWLDALEDQDHISRFYVVAPTKREFDAIKSRVQDQLGPLTVVEEDKRPMAEGFAANLEYFRLDFLEPTRVQLRRAFREILPLLWLKAGAVGPRPTLARGAAEPELLLPESSNFAVLLDESRLQKALRRLAKAARLDVMYLVTDDEEAFRAMGDAVRDVRGEAGESLETVQLYRNYLDNFTINRAGPAEGARP